MKLRILILFAITITASGCMNLPDNGDSKNRELKSNVNGSLANQLVELYESKNRERHARANGIEYKEGMVNVLIHLKSGAKLPKSYVENSSSYQNTAYAWIEVDDLPKLARKGEVRKIEVYSQPQPG